MDGFAFLVAVVSFVLALVVLKVFIGDMSNLEGLLRGDSGARASFYQQMLSNGVMTINEVRALENLPPVEGGDVPRMQMQNVPITQVSTGAAPVLPPADPGASP